MKGLEKFLLLALLACGTTALAWGSASDLYISQSGTGAKTGSSCNDSFPVSFFNTASNWGTAPTQIGAGTTVHLCGTFSSSLVAQASGSSGAPITVLFEAGAKISQPFCAGNGCMDLGGKTFITVDGGSDGIIENTDNGTGLGHRVASTGIFAVGSSNLVVRNLTIQNTYIHTTPDDTTQSPPGSTCIYVLGASNVSIHDNIMHDAAWCVFAGNGNISNLNIYNNDMYRVDHGIAIGVVSTGFTMSNINLYNNHIHDPANWDTNTNVFHHDGIHVFAYCAGSVPCAQTKVTGMNIYDNLFDGDYGVNVTAAVFFEGTIDTVNVFNNVGIASPGRTFSNGLYCTGASNLNVYNNTAIGSGGGICSVVAGTNVTYKNNLNASCDTLIWAKNITFASGGLDNNLYANGGGNAFVHNSRFFNFGQIAAWRSATGGDADAATTSNAQFDGSGRPQMATSVTKIGANLAGVSGLASVTLAALIKDHSGASRPLPPIAWDAGAYNAGSASAGPLPPTGLTAVVK